MQQPFSSLVLPATAPHCTRLLMMPSLERGRRSRSVVRRSCKAQGRLRHPLTQQCRCSPHTITCAVRCRPAAMSLLPEDVSPLSTATMQVAMTNSRSNSRWGSALRHTAKILVH
ncbi:hypothetical protein SORBI_3008G100201 [Sorghum bicolor]|uniref:Uncharacterized protein n=1 Tax=Sorghum bicolor TaxID=4558 RepID=A0A1Z5R5W7_SORBI|nr:hypothetical protein SORBI_3008G100201 [Sorghum bicolor]